ncbi:hypothetical protein DICPUDRAFT_151923 [Dictyostelium purpureum]|uniref:Uncharacterized protein n=1 Tax=Dictyostelium purpureum TaxID=5786 RepID=F0ZK33_DICPU|nr:uncharacterized protein DICPUDRAFT_151923 [Dictyostelium purpureum]EGC35705.1 hypothetical protein DICPUDRAFT_151923 [Dictyostelium purpureum]|eukprot:XP_003287761.1 hypothetical protein DICPUDRAFT_151923 [Dictyostelium purpureum]
MVYLKPNISGYSWKKGTISKIIAITELLKQYNALSFWDCACAAPNIQIDMNPLNDSSFKKQCSL